MKSLEQQLEALTAARDRADVDELRELLGKALTSKQSLVAARAAEIAGEQLVSGLDGALRKAFNRFAGSAADKGCRAKLACLDALRRLGCDDWQLYRKAAGIVQREPVWGGQVDVAGELRAVAALGLAESHDPEALVRLADILADPEPAARVGAARALGATGRADAAAALLRLRVLTHEDHPEVLSACLQIMLEVDPVASLDFAQQQLASADPQRVEAALLAVGQSRCEGALALLSEFWPRTLDAGVRRTALLAIATVRSDDATQYLLNLIRRGDDATASLAAEALSIYEHDRDLQARVRSLLEER